MKCVGFHRVVLRVKDRDEAIKLWSGILGSDFGERRINEEINTRACSHPTMQMEVIAPLMPGNRIDKTLQAKGEGVEAIALKVENLDDAVKEMQAKGIRMIRRTEHGKRSEALFHPDDCGGVLLIIGEYPDPMR